MSEEEIKDIFNLICNYRALNYFGYNSSEIGYTALNEALSLIDKLQKENEELKGIKNGTTTEYIGKATYWRKDKIEKYFISKDKIRELIKKLESKEIQCYCNNNATDFTIKILKDLLGE